MSALASALGSFLSLFVIGVLRLSDDLIGKSVLHSKIASTLGILVKSLSGQRESYDLFVCLCLYLSRGVLTLYLIFLQEHTYIDEPISPNKSFSIIFGYCYFLMFFVFSYYFSISDYLKHRV